MNLALGAIILYTLFIVPSLFYNRFYYSGEFSKQYLRSTPFELFLSSVVPGILFQFVFYGIVTLITGYSVDFKTLGHLISGGEEKDVAAAFENLEGSIWLIFIYNVSLWALLAPVGLISKFTVRKLKLDRRFILFRYKNYWHYLLRGEILDFPHIEGRESDIDFTYLNVLVNVGDSIYLYSGVLDHIQLTNEGSGLDYILLSSVDRREVVKGVDPTNAPSIVFAGDFFQIPYSSIVNINIHFVRMQDG